MVISLINIYIKNILWYNIIFSDHHLGSYSSTLGGWRAELGSGIGRCHCGRAWTKRCYQVGRQWLTKVWTEDNQNFEFRGWAIQRSCCHSWWFAVEGTLGECDSAAYLPWEIIRVLWLLQHRQGVLQNNLVRCWHYETWCQQMVGFLAMVPTSSFRCHRKVHEHES